MSMFVLSKVVSFTNLTVLAILSSFSVVIFRVMIGIDLSSHLCHILNHY